jgi:hypothetical protein
VKKRRRRTCRVCGRKDNLSNHHLIPRVKIKDLGLHGQVPDQPTIKLCKERHGCNAHFRFHRGSRKIARTIRQHLTKRELAWMVKMVGQEWVDQTYPDTKESMAA